MGLIFFFLLPWFVLYPFLFSRLRLKEPDVFAAVAGRHIITIPGFFLLFFSSQCRVSEPVARVLIWIMRAYLVLYLMVFAGVFLLYLFVALSPPPA